VFIAKLRSEIYQTEAERDEAIRQRAKIDHPSSPSVRSAVHALTDGHCAYCDDRLLGDDWHVEHVVPASLGGPDSIANYVPACKPCNHKKSTKHVIEFIKLRRGKFTVVDGDKAAEA
jgi:5-methylcytosine-specific restriction endonuclease McrA